MARVKKRKGVRKTINTAQGTAYYLHTEVEGPRGGWDDHWKTTSGYWVIHRDNEHHVYSTNERHKPKRKKRTKAEKNAVSERTAAKIRARRRKK